MKTPRLLSLGDTIGVCAPSSGVPHEMHARLDNAIKNVNALGYGVLETPSVRQSHKCVSASADARALEFMSLYESPAIAAIIPPWGGEFLMDMLPYLDFDAIAKLPPKWVCGFSDTTTLLFPLTLMCDVATVHGSAFMQMGYREIHSSDLRVFEAISNTEITQKSWNKYGGYDAKDITHDIYALTNDSAWKSLHGSASEAFEGRVIGGCLDVLCKLLGTKYAPVAPFLEEYASDGFIWTLESCEMNAGDIYRTLWQMRECGWFEHCRGFVIGRPDGYSDTKDFTHIDALTQGIGDLGVPIIYDADIGHVPPQMQFINGALARVDFADGAATVTQKLL